MEKFDASLKETPDCPGEIYDTEEFSMNDQEREMWVMNDEGIYRWWKSSRKSMRAFIKENREQLTRIILAAIDPRRSID